MTNFQNRIVGVIGRKGSGKSTRVGRLLKFCPRIFAWDPMEDHADLLPDGFEGVDDDLDEYLKQARRAKTFACSFVPAEDLEEEFEEVCRLIYDHGRMLFVVEEAPLVSLAWECPFCGDQNEWCYSNVPPFVVFPSPIPSFCHGCQRGYAIEIRQKLTGVVTPEMKQ